MGKFTRTGLSNVGSKMRLVLDNRGRKERKKEKKEEGRGPKDKYIWRTAPVLFSSLSLTINGNVLKALRSPAIQKPV